MNKGEIHEISLSCGSEIEDLLRAVGDSNFNWSDDISVRDVEQTRDRFFQWASNLGAFHKPESRLSLGQRLRDNPVVKDTVLKLLENLRESISGGKSCEEVSSTVHMFIVIDEYTLLSSGNKRIGLRRHCRYSRLALMTMTFPQVIQTRQYHHL